LALSLQENRRVTGLKNWVEGWRLFMLSSIEITTLQERICRPLENHVRHVVLRCESGGTRIVSVVDCDYNNVVFAANEDLFDKMLGALVEAGT
jgi:hypothetical protein